MSPQKRRCDDTVGAKFWTYVFPLACALAGGAASWGMTSKQVASQEIAIRRLEETVGTLRETVSGNRANIEALIRGGST